MKEKCLYIYDQEPPHQIYSEFDHVQTHPADLGVVRQMEIFSYEDTYTRNSVFDGETMIQDLRETAMKSQEQGYAGLRVAGEMSWVMSCRTPIEHLIQYEAQLDAAFPHLMNLAGVCQYDERKFSPEVLIDVICTHPYLIIYGKLYENKYFYTGPRYISSARKISSADYGTMISIITEEEPLATYSG